jgi:uncharacterized protein YkwD
MKRFLILVFLFILTGSVYFGESIEESVMGPKPDRLDMAPARVTYQSSGHRIFLPMLMTPTSWINTASRETSQSFYSREYLASEGISNGWTGNHNSCDQGTTTAEFQQAIFRRVNYFRVMAGVPPLAGFSDEYNQKAQNAALLMGVNRQLSHSPDDGWTCFSQEGQEGAGNSNLYLGVFGPSAISGYIRDPGANNYFVGHRRWILYPQSRYLGTGDVPARDGYLASNAFWAFDHDNIWGPRPATRDGYVAWPPPGFIPYQVVYPRWSISYPEADFKTASVSMTRNGQPIGLVVNKIENGYGENTLVWEPQESFGQAPSADIKYRVNISNVLISGKPQIFSYEVIVFVP